MCDEIINTIIQSIIPQDIIDEAQHRINNIGTFFNINIADPNYRYLCGNCVFPKTCYRYTEMIAWRQCSNCNSTLPFFSLSKGFMKEAKNYFYNKRNINILDKEDKIALFYTIKAKLYTTYNQVDNYIDRKFLSYLIPNCKDLIQLII